MPENIKNTSLNLSCKVLKKVDTDMRNVRETVNRTFQIHCRSEKKGVRIKWIRVLVENPPKSQFQRAKPTSEFFRNLSIRFG